MNKVNFLRYDPEDMHDCDHCQNLVLDLGRGLVCRVHDEEMTYVHAVNDCKDWKSPYLSDYRRRPDLENELKKGTKK